ncbi:tellurite resistance TerB family protein [Calothrix sp. NIES-2098]|uniref:tellurite resistance TerB family protein n=1 Tax=Calothrix sp. NIES-2098 TaxID=1954171 RepID=UPI000B5FA92F|nr:hypothetical protein NIES2098_02750 [Calothrix sp. NIES-2098]
MGSLDTVLGKNSQAQVKLSSAEAFVAITLAATSLDGYLSEEEARCISSVLSRLKLFRNYTNEPMNSLFEKILGMLRRDDINILFDTAKESLTPDLREAAFAVATDLLLSEGIPTEEETNFLYDLHQALSISRDVAIQIVQVIVIKNRA